MNIVGKSATRVAIKSIADDQQATLYGQMCVEKGQAKNTHGTGSFLLMHTGKEKITSQNCLLTTIELPKWRARLCLKWLCIYVRRFNSMVEMK